jgi:hypothetical protein
MQKSMKTSMKNKLKANALRICRNAISKDLEVSIVSIIGLIRVNIDEIWYEAWFNERLYNLSSEEDPTQVTLDRLLYIVKTYKNVKD